MRAAYVKVCWNLTRIRRLTFEQWGKLITGLIKLWTLTKEPQTNPFGVVGF